jgi:SAM-dependent methyltransferase
MNNSSEDISKYLKGDMLYGDDFTPEQIEKWFADEKEAYAQLLIEGNTYDYYLVNFLNAFHYLPKNVQFDHALGFGAAEGDEFIPLIHRINQITIVDPSDHFARNDIEGKSINRVKPQIEGKLQFENDSFDLITCFGVLHHIPNVSILLSEFRRVLKPGGILLIREPIVSMGDWRFPRKYLTSRERGLPLPWFRTAIKKVHLQITKEIVCEFRLLQFLPNYYKYFTKSGLFIKLDRFLGRLFLWNYSYHPKNAFGKIRPMAVYYVLKK